MVEREVSFVEEWLEVRSHSAVRWPAAKNQSRRVSGRTCCNKPLWQLGRRQRIKTDSIGPIRSQIANRSLDTSKAASEGRFIQIRATLWILWSGERKIRAQVLPCRTRRWYYPVQLPVLPNGQQRSLRPAGQSGRIEERVSNLISFGAFA